jgi:acyl-CoA thioester hydrolase
LNPLPITALPVYRSTLAAEWIDYNGHLRDGYYAVIVSHAIDDLMDRLGLDSDYRARSGCTLFTLELHLHYLHEVKQADELESTARVIAADRKRMHAGLELACAREPGPVAVAEVLLLHVRQGATPAAVAFPPHIARAIEALRALSATRVAAGPVSRRIELSRP